MNKLPPVIGTWSGGCFHVLEPRPEEVRLDDIAHHLGKVCRYTGATHAFWSVAAHCIEVSKRIALAGGSPIAQLQGLLHDAPEAYLVDLPRPIKDNEWPRYREIDARIEGAICYRLGVPRPFDPMVKAIDDTMIHVEVANFFRPGSFMWDRYDIRERRYDLKPLSPEEGPQAWLDRYRELCFLAGLKAVA